MTLLSLVIFLEDERPADQRPFSVELGESNPLQTEFHRRPFCRSVTGVTIPVGGAQ
jgi:hypothetical protein